MDIPRTLLRFKINSQAWCTPVIFEKLRLDQHGLDSEFYANLGYRVSLSKKSKFKKAK